MDKKVLLMILDGWGIGDHTKSDVISTMHPAYISAMTERYPHAELRTDTSVCPTVRGATRRWVTSISARAAWGIRIW